MEMIDYCEKHDFSFLIESGCPACVTEVDEDE